MPATNSSFIKRVRGDELTRQKSTVLERFIALESRVLPVQLNEEGVRDRPWRDVCGLVRREPNVKLAIQGPDTVKYCMDYMNARGGPVQSIETWIT